eukprot:3554987-Rhodomonas_salina.1
MRNFDPNSAKRTKSAGRFFPCHRVGIPARVKQYYFTRVGFLISVHSSDLRRFRVEPGTFVYRTTGYPPGVRNSYPGTRG